jgi:hypothetical protein
MIVYHYEALSYIDIDSGNLWGSWPHDPRTPGDVDWEWPYATIASNNNVILVTGDYNADIHHYYVTTDEGNTWTYLGVIGSPDSCITLSQFVRASRNPGSHKIVHAWTQSIALEYAGYTISTYANNVHYQLSTDDGVTWGMPVRVTNYTPPITMANGDSTPWAFCHVNAVFDNNDNLHIAWGAHLGWVQNDTIYYGERAKIFHWDEVSNTVSTVNSPSTYYPEPEGWWLQRSLYTPVGEPGAWENPGRPTAARGW